jgi:cytochrome c-type biogenesis protein CcmH
VSESLAIALVGLSALALVILLVPLFVRRRDPASREAYDFAVYRDQLAEVERDLARGVLATEQAEAARAEIARRILALRPPPASAGAAGTDGSTASRTPLRAAVAAVILLVPVAAWMLYARLGSPSVPDQPLAERMVAGPHPDMNDALARLEAHLKEQPEDLTGWLLLARSEMGLGRYRLAAEAYRHAAGLSGQRGDIASDWGEAQVLAAGGTVTPAAQAAFAAGLRDKATEPRARYYLALAQMQRGDPKAALDAWAALASEAPADAEWLPLVRRRIAEAAKSLGIDPATLGGAAAAPGETAVTAAAKAAANASPEERQAMIRAMVDRLAARLQTEPDDVEGWARLGRSYMVLKEPAKAKDAYTRAVKLKPDDPELSQALAAASAAASGKADVK